MKYASLFLLIFCCCGANWCKQGASQNVQQIIPQQIVVYSGHPAYYGYYSHYYYVPVMTQNVRYVPYVENRIEYQPAVQYNYYVPNAYQNNYVYPYYYNY
jgi:hypothetical protein